MSVSRMNSVSWESVDLPAESAPSQGGFLYLSSCVGQVWCHDGNAENGEHNAGREERMQGEATY